MAVSAKLFPMVSVVLLLNSYEGLAKDSQQKCTTKVFEAKDSHTIWTPNTPLLVAERKAFAGALDKAVTECKNSEYSNCDNVIVKHTDTDYGKIFSTATSVVHVEGRKCMLDGKLIKDVIYAENNFFGMYNEESILKKTGCNEALTKCTEGGFNDCKIINERLDNPNPPPAKFKPYMSTWYFCVVHGQTTTATKESSENSEVVNDGKRSSKVFSRPSETFTPADGISK